MSKWTEFRDRIDDREVFVDRMGRRVVENPHTARIVLAVVLVLILAELSWWLL